jgi:2-C-methyl-D-erythritol 4-phosphate cytidylyltransferase
MNKYLLIVAGGKGLRMGVQTPKQFLNIKEKPIIYNSILPFIDTYPDIKVIAVLPEDYFHFGQRLRDMLPSGTSITFTTGGETRFHSVQNGLKLISEAGIVFVHDAARPLITSSLVTHCYQTALEHGSAIPVVPVAESVRVITESGTAPVDRTTLRIVQTPQTFHTEILLEAFRQPYTPLFTDEATVAEANGNEVFLVEGEKRNIKITTQEDLQFAEYVLGHSIANISQ